MAGLVATASVIFAYQVDAIKPDLSAIVFPVARHDFVSGDQSGTDRNRKLDTTASDHGTVRIRIARFRSRRLGHVLVDERSQCGCVFPSGYCVPRGPLKWWKWRIFSTPFLYPARDIRAMIDQPASPARHVSVLVFWNCPGWYAHAVLELPIGKFGDARMLSRDIAPHNAPHCSCNFQQPLYEARSTPKYQYIAVRGSAKPRPSGLTDVAQG